MDSKLPYRFAALVFALGILGGWVVDLHGLWKSDLPFPSSQISWKGAQEGSAARVIESYLADNSTLAATYRPFYNDLLFSIVRASSQKIVVGRDMLFDRTRVELHNATYWNEKRAKSVTYFADLDRKITSLGGKFTLAIIPDRIRVYPEQLPNWGFVGSAKEAFFQDLHDDLSKRGISAVNLLRVFQDYRREKGDLSLLYRRDDHHWNGKGALLASRAVAQELGKLGVAPQTGSNQDLVLVPKSIKNRGSLMNRTGWASTSHAFQMFEDGVTQDEVIDKATGEPVASSKDEDIAILTDSFGLFFSRAQIAMELSHGATDFPSASKQSIYATTRLFHDIAWGWRPRHVVLLTSERGLYSANGEFDGWNFFLPKASEPMLEVPIPMSDLTVNRGIESSIALGHRTLKMTSRFGALRLDRKNLRGALHFVIYVLATKATVGAVNIGLITEIPKWGKIRKNRVQVLDGEREWQRVLLSIPEGKEDLLLAINLKTVGRFFQIRNPGILIPLKSVSPSASPWVPTGMREVSTKKFRPHKVAPSLVAKTVSNPGSAELQVQSSCAVFFTNEAKKNQSLRLTLKAKGNPEQLESRIVATLFHADLKKQTRRYLAQVEILLPKNGEAEKQIEVPILQDGHLGVEVRVPQDNQAPQVTLSFH